MDKVIEAVALVIEPLWFGEIDGVHPLDNYPGQHKNYQELARAKARAAVKTTLYNTSRDLHLLGDTCEMGRSAMKEYTAENISATGLVIAFRAIIDKLLEDV